MGLPGEQPGLPQRVTAVVRPRTVQRRRTKNRINSLPLLPGIGLAVCGLMKRPATNSKRPLMAGLALLALLAAPFSPARAEPTTISKPARQPSLLVGAEALTELPLLVGGRLWVELPGRIRVSTSLGYLPEAYGSAFNQALVSAGAYDQQTGDVVGAALASSLVWRVDLGWRPVSGSGWYLEAGYMLALLGAGMTQQSLEAALGVKLPAAAAAVGELSLDVSLHMIHAETGWQWRLPRGITLRLGLGAAVAVGASSSISVGNPALLPPGTSAVLGAAEAEINDTLTSYVVTPTLTLALGWQVGLL